MINRFISSLPAYTLESLIANGRWTAAQLLQGKKNGLKTGAAKKAEQPDNKKSRPVL